MSEGDKAVTAENSYIAMLNPKQALFVRIYARTLNPTRSYEQAGYKAKGRSATAAANRLLSNDVVRWAVDAEIALLSRALCADSRWVIKRLASEAAGEHLAGEKKGQPIPDSTAATRVSALCRLAKLLCLNPQNQKPEKDLHVSNAMGDRLKNALVRLRRQCDEDDGSQSALRD